MNKEGTRLRTEVVIEQIRALLRIDGGPGNDRIFGGEGDTAELAEYGGARGFRAFALAHAVGGASAGWHVGRRSDRPGDRQPRAAARPWRDPCD